MSLRTAIGLCILIFFSTQKALCSDTDNEYKEIVYVSLDKSFYLSGEYLKFKVYCLEAETKLFSQLSKVAYIELLDTSNNSVIQAKIQLKNGIGYGDIFIPSNFNSGNYLLRAYTKWMRNFGVEDFFHSIIQIINPFKKAGLMPKFNDVTLKFFPEGGELIYGLTSKIAFQATNVRGKGVNFLGYIIDESDSSLIEFSPLESGLGSFLLKPEQNKTYRAKIILKDSSEILFKLPEIKDKGYLMHVESLNNKEISVKVKASDIHLNNNIVLTGRTDERIQFTRKLILDDGTGDIRINLDEIDPGIMQINLINPEGQLLNHRHVFVYPKEKVNLKLNSNKNTYATREKIIVKVSAEDLAQKPVNMDLSVSVSVYNAQFGTFNRDINSYFLLKCVKNRTNKNYLDPFDEVPGKNRTIMDHLMLINSDCNYNQENIQNSMSTISYIPEYRHHIITGRLTDNGSNFSEEGIMAYLSTPSKNALFYAAQSLPNGKLIYEVSDLKDRNKIILQTDYTKNTNYTIELDDPFSKQFANIIIPRFDLDKELQNLIEKTSKNMQIQNAYLKYSPAIEIISNKDSSTFYEPDAVYYLDDYTRFPVMEEVMREYVGGVYVRRNQDGYHFKILDLDRIETFKENPLMLLDGIPIFDANEIMELDPLDIKKIETVRKKFIKDGFFYSGIVSFSTYNNDLKGYQLNERAKVVEYEGVQAMKGYISPEYKIPSDKDSRIPDYRNVLFWNPQFKTDKKGEAVLEFYASDDVSEYEIRVEGISDDGRTAYSNLFIQVVNDHE